MKPKFLKNKACNEALGTSRAKDFETFRSFWGGIIKRSLE
jgi:hypothetical protein